MSTVLLCAELGILLTFISPFLALLFFAVPVSDDYCKASLSYRGEIQSSGWELAWKYYWGWSSRWLSALLQTTVMTGIDLLRWYMVPLLTIIVSVVVSVILFLCQSLQMRPRDASLVATVFFAGWLASISSPAQNVFWLTVAIEYQLSLAVILVVLAILLNDRCNGRGWIILILVLAGAAPALHELAGVYLFCLAAIGLALRIKLHLPTRKWVILLAANGLSLVVALLAPGPRLRAAKEGSQLLSLASLPHNLLGGADALHDWLLAPVIIAVVIWSLMFVRSRIQEKSMAGLSDNFLGVFCLLGACIAPLLLVFAEAASVLPLPARAVGWMQFLFWLFLLCFVLSSAPTVSCSKDLLRARAYSSILLFFALLGSAHFRQAGIDIAFHAAPWREYVVSMLEGPELPRLHEQVPAKPVMFGNTGLKNDQKYWVNRCAANFIKFNKLHERLDSVVTR